MFIRVGLTGGIACGKSTVAQILVQKGALLIDADQLARRRSNRGTGLEGNYGLAGRGCFDVTAAGPSENRQPGF